MKQIYLRWFEEFSYVSEFSDLLPSLPTNRFAFWRLNLDLRLISVI